MNYKYVVIVLISMMFFNCGSMDSTSVKVNVIHGQGDPNERFIPSNPVTGAVYSVEYRVSGVERAKVIKFLSRSENPVERKDVKLPWRYKMEGTSRSNKLYISAVSDAESGCIEVEIYLDGVIYKNDRKCGEYASAEAGN